MTALTVVAAVVIVIVVIAVPGDHSNEAGPAPAFSLPALEERSPPLRLADLHGRPVIVNFWASWCVPCERELPAFERVHRRVGDDVAFIGINTRDSRRLGLELQERADLSYPSGFDPEGRVAELFRLVGMPTTVFISTEGQLLERHAGPLTEAELTDRIERHFGLTV